MKKFLTSAALNAAWILVAILAMSHVVGCDDGGPTGPNKPFASFSVDVAEGAMAFVATTTNTSVNHLLGQEDLSYLWQVQGKDDTPDQHPLYTFTYGELGLSVPGEEALREFKLILTEGKDPSRRDVSGKTVLFQRTVSGSSAVAVVALKGFGVERPMDCARCKIYRGPGRYNGAWYKTEDVILGRLD